jgi:hypothetical protein
VTASGGVGTALLLAAVAVLYLAAPRRDAEKAKPAWPQGP